MRDITTRDRLRYQFDQLMERGAPAMLFLLFGTTLLLVAAGAAVLTLSPLGPSQGPVDPLENAWLALMRAMDPGNVSADHGWGLRMVTLTITLGGLFVVSALISIISTGLDTRMKQMQKGRSFVVERDHILILGWSSKIYTILRELITANAESGGVVVILAERDKIEMDDDLRAYIGRTHKTKIVTRSGSPTDLVDLALVNPRQAKSVVVLAPEGPTADAETVKTILALTNNPDRRKEPYHIVAEIKAEQNLSVARLVGKDEVELISVDELVSRIMVQTCRQSGLSLVYNELMDFDGGEVYFRHFPSLSGRSYGEILGRFAHSSVLGLARENGKVTLNPPMDTLLGASDSIVALTENQSRLELSGQAGRFESDKIVREVFPPDRSPERTLILGWNRKGILILQELDRYVAQGSLVTVISSFELESQLEPLSKRLKNVELSYFEEDTSNRAVLEQLHVNDFQHVLLLAYSDDMSLQQADAQTMITLLHLRDIWERAGQPLKIVSEMLDLRNRDLANVTRADDFIVSEKLMSLLMGQVAENKQVMRVFDDLFHKEGSEIYLKPACEYVKPGATVDFYTVVEAARLKGETALGYRLMGQQYDSERHYGVVLNPLKSERFSLQAEDRIVVLAVTDA